MKSKQLKLVILLFTLLVNFACRHKKELTKKNTVVKKDNVKNDTSTKHSNNPLQEKLGLSNKEIKSSKLYVFINDWYGVPYKYGGCKKTGVDCSCFTDNLFLQVYGKKIGRTAGEIYKECEKIKVEKLEEGDLVFFITNGKSISHVGVYLKDNKFVHSSTSKGVVISDLNEAYYKKCFYAAAKLKA
ncbi:MAG: NlpC/P60 family protein [Bacteroidota bacterium]|nr:NlpC/P60 family protein [Bacteroidota bacterium]